MLSIFGNFSEPLSRRHFVTAGAMGMAGLTLADLLRAEANTKSGSTKKSIIKIGRAHV